MLILLTEFMRKTSNMLIKQLLSTNEYHDGISRHLTVKVRLCVNSSIGWHISDKLLGIRSPILGELYSTIEQHEKTQTLPKN